jgi:hypothetical protein
MQFFAVFFFMALAVMGLTLLGDRVHLREFRTLVAMVWGIGLSWLANLNMWVGWHIPNLRYQWVGVTLTGVALAGTALLLYAVFGFFFGLRRKLDDQAETLERTELRRIA